MSAPRVLPADVYDALEFSALAFGGIGAGAFTEDGNSVGHEAHAIPFCATAHCYAAQPHNAFRGEMSVARREAGISFAANDTAVRAINARRRVFDCNARVSFADWCAELGVVRGDS